MWGEGEMAGGGDGGREVDGKEDREMERHEVVGGWMGGGVQVGIRAGMEERG